MPTSAVSSAAVDRRTARGEAERRAGERHTDSQRRLCSGGGEGGARGGGRLYAIINADLATSWMASVGPKPLSTPRHLVPTHQTIQSLVRKTLAVRKPMADSNARAGGGFLERRIRTLTPSSAKVLPRTRTVGLAPAAPGMVRRWRSGIRHALMPLICGRVDPVEVRTTLWKTSPGAGRPVESPTSRLAPLQTRATLRANPNPPMQLTETHRWASDPACNEG